MFFRFDSSYLKSGICIIAKYRDSTIEYVVSALLTRRKKEEIDNPEQFALLNAYINYKGDGFKLELFNKLQDGYNDIVNTLSFPDIDPMPYHVVHDILDMFDIMDVFNYIKHIYKLEPPANLADEFDPMIEADGRGTRVQTYLKDDYLELAALSTILRATLGVLGHYAYIKKDSISPIHKEYTLMRFYKYHPLFKTSPVLKLMGFVDKHVNLPTNDDSVDSVRVLEKQISKDEISYSVFAAVMLQRVAVATLVSDSARINIITNIHNYINNKLRPVSDAKKAIRDKKPLSDGESGGDELESMIESYRIMTSHTAGDELEIMFAVSSIELILRQLPAKQREVIDMSVLADAVIFCNKFNKLHIDQLQVILLTYVFKGILHPNSFPHLKSEDIIRLFSVGFAYLWGIGSKHLAILMTSCLDNSTSDTVRMNTTVNRTRISKELKDELDILFPYGRVINETTVANVAEESINELANIMFDYRWIPTATDKYIVEATGDKNINNILPSDLKVKLAEFIIKNERLVYA